MPCRKAHETFLCSSDTQAPGFRECSVLFQPPIAALADCSPGKSLEYARPCARAEESDHRPRKRMIYAQAPALPGLSADRTSNSFRLLPIGGDIPAATTCP